jgi:hypothetical protein
MNIVSWVFEDSTIVGLVNTLGMKNQFVVEKGAFTGGSGPAIQIIGFLALTRTCFNRNGIVFKMRVNERLKIGDDCCFRATKEIAISDGIEIIEESGFSCMLECTPESVSFEVNVCFGNSFENPSTPWQIRVPIAPVRIRPTQ